MKSTLGAKSSTPGSLLSASREEKTESKKEKKAEKKNPKLEKKETMKKTKPQGKGIVKALGQKGTTGNFKKIAASKGKAAAIGALQNKLAKRRGNPIPYGNKK
jgi:hypothetical protein